MHKLIHRLDRTKQGLHTLQGKRSDSLLSRAHHSESDNSDDEDDSDDSHGPIDLTPPSGVLISNLIYGPDAMVKGSLDIGERSSGLFAAGMDGSRRKR